MVKMNTTLKHKKKNNVKKNSNKNKSNKNKKTTRQKKYYRKRKYSRKMKGGRVCIKSSRQCLTVVAKYGDASSANKPTTTIIDEGNGSGAIQTFDNVVDTENASVVNVDNNTGKEIVDETAASNEIIDSKKSNSQIVNDGTGAIVENTDIGIVDNNTGKEIVDDNDAKNADDITVSDASVISENVDENAPVGITVPDSGSDIELVDNNGKGIVDENVEDNDVTNKPGLLLSESKKNNVVETEDNIAQQLQIPAPVVTTTGTSSSKGDVIVSGQPPQSLSPEEISTMSNNNGNNKKNTEINQQLSLIISDNKLNESTITSNELRAVDDIAIDTSTKETVSPLSRSSSANNFSTQLKRGKDNLKKANPGNVKKNDFGTLGTLAKGLLPRRKKIDEGSENDKAKFKIATDEYNLKLKLENYSDQFSKNNLNDTNIDKIMESFDDEKTISNQGKIDFLSKMLENNKYSKDINGRINKTILLIRAMIDQEPKMRTENQYDLKSVADSYDDSDDESVAYSDDGSDDGSDYGSDNKFEVGSYGSEGYNQFGNNRGGKTRRRRSRKMKTKKRKSRPSRKMRKNKKTRK